MASVHELQASGTKVHNSYHIYSVINKHCTSYSHHARLVPLKIMSIIIIFEYLHSNGQVLPHQFFEIR